MPCVAENGQSRSLCPCALDNRCFHRIADRADNTPKNRETAHRVRAHVMWRGESSTGRCYQMEHHRARQG